MLIVLLKPPRQRPEEGVVVVVVVIVLILPPRQRPEKRVVVLVVIVLLLPPRERPVEGVEVVVVVVLLPPRQDSSHNFAICCHRLNDCPRVGPFGLIRSRCVGDLKRTPLRMWRCCQDTNSYICAIDQRLHITYIFLCIGQF